MADRIMRVNAYTTLDLLDGTAEGHDFADESYATLNVTSPRKRPEHLTLQMELDNTQLSNLPAHADSVRMDPGQARKLANELEEHAQTVEEYLTEEE
jgi:hypothetical protein